MSEDGQDETPPPVREAFDLVGNETRAEVLRVLSEAREGDLPPALSFSELRDRVRTDPRSSRFNYHLQRLVGTFVEQREEGSAQLAAEFVDDETGYALRPEGTFLTRVLTAMSVPEDGGRTAGPFDADLDCHFCGAGVRARYENRTFQLRCPDCDHLFAYTLTPPGLASDDPCPDVLLDRAATYLRGKYTTFARGACPLCAGPVPPEVIDPAEINWPGADRLTALVRRTCRHCGNLNYALVGTELLVDPEVVAFCRERSLDVARGRLWEFPFAITDRHTTVVAEDPWRAELSVPGGDEALAVRVDADLNVVDRERR